MSRKESLHSFSEAFYGKRLTAKLTVAEMEQVIEFLNKNEHLSYLDFEYAANRWFLDSSDKPKNWAIMTEIVISANSRARGI
jgi:hypothetical protein